MSIETITHPSGYYAELWHDEGAESPLDSDSAFKITYLDRSRYILGNEPVRDPEEWLADRVAPFLLNGYDTIERNRDTIGDDRTDAALWRHFHRHYIALPVFAHIHSGVALSCGGFSCPWDSGQSGMIYASRKQIREEWQTKRIDTQRINKTMRAVVEDFSRWLNGEVYGFTIYGPEGETLDSCGWIIGYEHAEEEAQAALVAEIEWQKTDRARKIEQYAATASQAIA